MPLIHSLSSSRRSEIESGGDIDEPAPALSSASKSWSPEIGLIFASLPSSLLSSSCGDDHTSGEHVRGRDAEMITHQVSMCAGGTGMAEGETPPSVAAR